jgi:DNA-binding Xre family transcriptional regulator
MDDRFDEIMARPRSRFPRRLHERPLDDFEPAIREALIRLGVWVKGKRERAGISQGQLERLSGLDQTAISRLENGRLRHLRLHRLAAVLAALDGLRLEDPERDRGRPTR